MNPMTKLFFDKNPIQNPIKNCTCIHFPSRMCNYCNVIKTPNPLDAYKTYKYIGVSFDSTYSKWILFSIGLNGKRKKIGSFGTKEDAVRARDEATKSKFYRLSQF